MSYGVLNNHKNESKQLIAENHNSGDFGEFIGQCPAMQAVYRMIQQVSPSKANIFIAGETGTGKELVARAIHAGSDRKGAFISVNCAAIPDGILESELFGHVRGAFTGAYTDRKGKFELAHNGTLFLDEITEMPLNLQAKLLRALQESTVDCLGGEHAIDVDVRLVTSTNLDPLNAMREGKLRKDLYYRINVVNIKLPPLRERRDDIILLAQYFINKYQATVPEQSSASSFQLTDEIIRLLMEHKWPGNVRELENMMERAVVLNHKFDLDFPHLATGHKNRRLSDSNSSYRGRRVADKVKIGVIDEGIMDLSIHTANMEIRLLQKALTLAAGNKALAARILKISERSLWYKIEKYGLSSKSKLV